MRRLESRIDILIIIIASMTTIFSLIVGRLFPDFQVLVLTILTILLALIYQIGNIYSKENIKEENEGDFLILDTEIEKQKREIDSLKEKNRKLKNK